MSQPLNQKQFADYMGFTKGYVTQLKQAGRLVFAENGMVDVQASEIRIKETADPSRDDVKNRHASERHTEIEKTDVKLEKPKKEKNASEVTFSEARAKEQHFKSLQAELDYKKAIGEVVLASDMQSAVGDVVTTFRQSLENKPQVIAPQLVGKDLDFIRATLKQEIASALAEMERNFDEKLKARSE